MAPLSKSRRRIFIHAGTHKTGTTSIQKMLLDNETEIENYGLSCIHDHPSNEIAKTNCMLIANAFIRPELWTPARINRRMADFKSPEIIKWFNNQCNKYSNSDLIISSESFCYLRTREERDFLLQCLEDLGLEAKPLIFFRNDNEWRRSRKDQLRKNKAIKCFIKERSNEFTLLDDWYFDREAIMRFWLGISRDCIFIDYTREAQLRGSVLPAFLNAVGLSLSIDPKEYFLNKTPRSRLFFRLISNK